MKEISELLKKAVLLYKIKGFIISENFNIYQPCSIITIKADEKTIQEDDDEEGRKKILEFIKEL